MEKREENFIAGKFGQKSPIGVVPLAVETVPKQGLAAGRKAEEPGQEAKNSGRKTKKPGQNGTVAASSRQEGDRPSLRLGPRILLTERTFAPVQTVRPAAKLKLNPEPASRVK